MNIKERIKALWRFLDIDKLDFAIVAFCGGVVWQFGLPWALMGYGIIVLLLELIKAILIHKQE